MYFGVSHMFTVGNKNFKIHWMSTLYVKTSSSNIYILTHRAKFFDSKNEADANVHIQQSMRNATHYSMKSINLEHAEMPK